MICGITICSAFLMIRTLVADGIKTDYHDFFYLHQLCDHVIKVPYSEVQFLDRPMQSIFRALRLSTTTKNIQS